MTTNKHHYEDQRTHGKIINTVVGRLGYIVKLYPNLDQRQTEPRSVHHPKLESEDTKLTDPTRKVLIREAARRSMITVEEL